MSERERGQPERDLALGGWPAAHPSLSLSLAPSAADSHGSRMRENPILKGILAAQREISPTLRVSNESNAEKTPRTAKAASAVRWCEGVTITPAKQNSSLKIGSKMHF